MLKPLRLLRLRQPLLALPVSIGVFAFAICKTSSAKSDNMESRSLLRLRIVSAILVALKDNIVYYTLPSVSTPLPWKLAVNVTMSSKEAVRSIDVINISPLYFFDPLADEVMNSPVSMPV